MANAIPELRRQLGIAGPNVFALARQHETPCILAITCLACALHAAEIPTLRLLQTIPLPEVKGRFDHFAIDTKGQRLFVAALGNDTVEVLDLAAGKRCGRRLRSRRPLLRENQFTRVEPKRGCL
jgi:hypothetical protein